MRWNFIQKVHIEVQSSTPLRSCQWLIFGHIPSSLLQGPEFVPDHPSKPMLPFVYNPSASPNAGSIPRHHIYAPKSPQANCSTLGSGCSQAQIHVQGVQAH
eukprot:scaffold213806_cov14-Tisochrysis_lutea.AAC.1